MSFVFLYGPDREGLGIPSIGERILFRFSHQLELSSVVYNKIPRGFKKGKFKWSYDPRSYERNFCNCVEKPQRLRITTGFEPVTSQYRCDALTN